MKTHKHKRNRMWSLPLQGMRGTHGILPKPRLEVPSRRNFEKCLCLQK